MTHPQGGGGWATLHHIQMLIAGVDKYVVHMILKGPCHMYIYIYVHLCFFPKH